ncbi:MAG: hypothetical protein JWM80_6352, partial [Cyanobacteria bacterium RYN_339]|nr:hypothetical protein [Cyanobacteria bacterium RYN_339]
MALFDGIAGTQSYAPQPVGGRLLQWANDQVERGVDSLVDRFHPSQASAAAPLAGGALPGNKADEFIRQAMRFLGQPYVYGAGHGGTVRGPSPVDCSGLVQQAARLAGLNLDGTAASQQRHGTSVSMNALKPGDLVFHGNPASHVGIYIGNGKVLHAPHTGDHVKIVDLATYHYFTNARRVFDAPGSAAPDSPTPAPAPAPAVPYTPVPLGGTVTVQNGDSLTKLAQRLLGDSNRWREIYNLNKNKIQDPNLIYSGQNFTLPGASVASVPPPPP